MKIPKSIREDDHIEDDLKQRNLLKQYSKAKSFILSGFLGGSDFKERQPQGSGIWSFRINKQFRARGVFDDDQNLRIFKIDDHA